MNINELNDDDEESKIDEGANIYYQPSQKGVNASASFQNNGHHDQLRNYVEEDISGTEMIANTNDEYE